MLSAYAAHFYSNNTAVCAIGGKQGLYVTGTQNGIQVFSEYLAISAYSPKLGVSVASPVRALSAYSGFIGADIFSENKAISARGLKIGLEVSSPVRALSAYSNFIGADIFSENKAISARGLKIGLEVSSPVRAISANGNVIGVESYSNNISISSYGGTIGLHVTSPNKAIYAIGNAIGVESYSTTRAISAFGSLIGLEVASPIRAISAYSGFVGADIFSENKAISARGLKIGLEVSSPIRAISAYGGIIGIESYSLNIPLSTAFGKNIMHGWVGINNNTPTSALEVKGSTVLDGNVRITQEVKLDSNLTIFGNLSTLGNISYLDTFVTVTSAMSITNTGTGPALTVTQTGDEPIARFYDDAGLVALYVEGQSTKPGWVGIGTDNPNMALTVVGSISALSSLYVDQTITASSSLYVGHNAYINNELAVGQGTRTPMLSTTTIQSLGSEGVKVKASTGLYDIAHFSNDGNTTLSANLVIGGTVTAENQTAASGSSVMTRQLLDARGSYFQWCINLNSAAAKADDASWSLVPGGYNAFSSGMPASIPAEMTKFRVRVSMGFTSNPTSDTFPIYVKFSSQGINSTNTIETLHGTRVGNTAYPDTVGGLTGTLVDLAATHSGFTNTFAFTSDWVTIPEAWQTNAANVGSYGFIGIIVGNKSGGSLTDNYAQNHSIYGQIEFRR